MGLHYFRSERSTEPGCRLLPGAEIRFFRPATRALPHRHQADSLPVCPGQILCRDLRFPPPAVVAETAAAPRPVGPGVPRHVVQSFLHDAIHMNGRVAIDGERRTRFLIGYANSGLPFNRGRYQSSVLSRPGSSSITGCSACERLRTLSNVVCAISRTSSRSGEIGDLPAHVAGSAQHRSHGGENLPELIVQFARDIAQRGFLCRNQSLRQIAALLESRASCANSRRLERMR